jgi:hypothetical protein
VKHAHAGTEEKAKGRLIRHASMTALQVGALAVAMIETSFGALLVAAVGLAALLAPRLLAATRTAITLSPITVAAQIKHRTTRGEVTNPLAKNGGTGNRHRFRVATLDNRRRSWQDDSREHVEVLDRGRQ